jgi:hypothetical protein
MAASREPDMVELRGFVAYPSSPSVVGETIERVTHDSGLTGVKTWRATDIAGRFIAEEVLADVDRADYLIADVTSPNFNVTYEIGFAIGRGKRVLLVRYAPLSSTPPEFSEVGVFDTLGYREYQNSAQLVGLIRGLRDVDPIRVPPVGLNAKAPVYLIDALYKTDAVTRIISRVKKARLFFRSFDPNERPRLSAFEAIEQTAQSYGVLLHLLPSRVRDAPVHNVRAAFLAGLANGMGKVFSLLQEGDEPVPIDYRDLVTTFRHPAQIDEAVAEFAARVTEALQTGGEDAVAASRTVLEKLSLGASAAENELRDLEHYYIEVDAFQRALRGEARIVVGRKGSGKTALFTRLRDAVRRRSQHVVLDLKPEGYKLLRFKEVVLDLLGEGTREHTLTAFWEYLLLLEICRKLLESDQQRHMRDRRLFEPYSRLAELYASDEYVAEGDFAERMSVLLQRIRDDFEARFPGAERLRLSDADITQLLYRHDVSRLRTQVLDYLRFKDSAWLLFDNIDKGWPTHGIRPEDLIIIRTLLEAAVKIERELSRRGIDAHTVLFLRNDVFELLVEETPDRGKEAKVGVDWTDPDMLRELVRRRLVFSGMPEGKSFDELWRAVCVGLFRGEETSQFLIDRSLMRPRALLDLINHCRSGAVNLGRARIESDDIEKGLRLYSTDLVREISLEIRDVFPKGEDVLYAFIQAPSRMSQEQLGAALQPLRLSGAEEERLFEILLWYGVLGLVRPDGEAEYIHSLSYDMRLLKGKIRRVEGTAQFAVNPAFWPALGIVGTGS